MIAIDADLLDLLRCPVTGQRLRLVNVEPWPGCCPADLTGTVEAFLVTEDGTHAYPVRDGIPDLLPDSARIREPK